MLHNKRNLAGRARLLLLIAAVLVMTVAAGCGKKDEGGVPGAGKGDVIATYTDGNVTQTEFDKYIGFFSLMDQNVEMYLGFFKEQILLEYIGSKLLFAKLSEEAKDAVKEDLDNFEKELQSAANTQPELKSLMKEKNISVKEARYFYGMMIAPMKDVDSKITDEQVEEQFKLVEHDYDVISVRHVLVKTVDPQTGEEVRTNEEALEIAKEVKAKLDSSGDWDAIAKEYSDDDGSKEKGGLYENQKANGWVTGFKEAAITQPIGEIGEPVESQFGYHVMKVEARTSTAYADLTAEEKAALRQTTAGAKLNELVTAEREAQNVKVTLPEPEETPEGNSGNEGGNSGNGAGDGAAEGTDGAGNAGGEGAANSGNAGNEAEKPAQ